jgi:mono/diheme cytochrome c family protein
VRRIVFTALIALAVGGLLGACGGGGDDGGGGDGAAAGKAQAGEKVFAEAGCGGCHTLKAAGSSGMTGPNLDQLKPGEEQVVEQVTNGGGGMPAFKGRLSEQQIQDVAAFVAENAGG